MNQHDHFSSLPRLYVFRAHYTNIIRDARSTKHKKKKVEGLLYMPQQTVFKAVPVLSVPSGMPARALMNREWGSSISGSCF
jgi:hypothetical protein